jgi:MoxR-like ATPase
VTLPPLPSGTADPAARALVPASPFAAASAASRDATAVMMRALGALAVARLRVDELRETRRSVQLFGTRRTES